MAKPIATGNPGHRADESFCAWPNCYTQTQGFPICWDHALKVYAHVAESISPVFADRKPVVTERTGHVYFIRFDAKVKIGFSIDPMTRIKAHPHQEVLAVIPGTRADEKRCHAAFAHLRDVGEWFHAEAELLDFIRAIAA